MKQKTSGLFAGPVRRFLKSEAGSMLPVVAISAVTLTGAAGMAVDGARMYYVKDVLQKALDAAGLAAGHAMETDTMESDAGEFFNANVSAAGLSPADTALNMVVSSDNKLITLNARASVHATFMSLLGFDGITVTASTEVSRETRGMELVLVMDNTGSMRHDSKIDTMKTAANNLVEAVYGDHETNTNLWVGVVPYITHVNVGSANYGWLSAAGKAQVDSDYSPTNWAGCLEARAGGEDLTDTPPTLAPFDPYYWTDTDPFVVQQQKCSWKKGCSIVDVTIDKDNNWIDDDTGTRSVYEANSSSARGPNRGCASAVTPLVAEKSTVKAAIDVMEPWSFGGTAANLGLVWGWRVISPRWRGLWNGSPSNLPLDHDTPFMDKIIVILTDGKNEFIENSYSQLGYSDYTAFGRLSDLGYDNKEDGRDDMDGRFDTVCRNIKDDGIILYTITFGTTPDETTQAAYSACASNPSFYFHAPTADSLTTAFDTIGRQLSNLRLSK